MITMQRIERFLTGGELARALIEWMAEYMEDFAENYSCFLAAMDRLERELGESGTPTAAQEREAILAQAASDLLYAGMLGIKANLDHFTDPAGRDFLETDSEAYLRETTAHRLPEYGKAQAVRDRFFARLTPAQRNIYEDVTVFVCHLETAGPKLAHYYGYLMGNSLLGRLVPGYHPDQLQTIRYRRALEEYFGQSLPPH